jgi:membrane protein YqaA with SNARE-associated domain
MVAAVAMYEFAPVKDVWATTLLVASVGAAASMMANLHDYHIFTWMLRHRRIGRVRQTALYRRAERWFARRPFALLVIFNLLPLPADPPVRMLAATYRHPLRPYAAANFIGRWIRYAVVAFVTFELGKAGWVAVAVLLAVATVLACTRLMGRCRRRDDGEAGVGADMMGAGKEPGE